MEIMKVLVCDDDPQQCESNARAIRGLNLEDVEVKSLHSTDLTTALTHFFEHIDAKGAGNSEFDTSDIIILDNNLSHLQIAGARLTAETIAGYIRAHSASSPYLVSLNKNPEVDFDLRYLVGDYSTVADIAINNNHLSNRALWTGNSADAASQFFPWYWPCLLSQPEKRRRQVENVRKNLGAPIFSTLGISRDTASYMSRHATGTLSHESPFEAIDSTRSENGKAIFEVSFRDFFLSRNRSIPDIKERESLIGVLGDENTNVISRAIAADIDLWVRRDLVAPQDALVDLPHLLVRMPFLLGARIDSIEDWTNYSSCNDDNFGLDAAIFADHVNEARINDEIWGTTPTFLWPTLQKNEKLNEIYFNSKTPWPDVVFCEDLSRFVAQNTNAEGDPVRFEAEFEGAWTRRYVVRIPEIKYSPRSRFAL